MALPSLADLATFKTWPGVTVPDGQDSSAQLVLDATSSAARRRARRTWVDTDGKLSGVPDGVDYIVLAAAARFWTNPTARSLLMAGQEQEQFAGVAAGITFTAEELAGLVDASGRGGFGVLSTTRGECW